MSLKYNTHRRSHNIMNVKCHMNLMRECLGNPCMTVMLKKIGIQNIQIYRTLTRFIFLFSLHKKEL